MLNETKQQKPTVQEKKIASLQAQVKTLNSEVVAWKGISDDNATKREEYRAALSVEKGRTSNLSSKIHDLEKEVRLVLVRHETTKCNLSRALGYIDRANEGRKGEITKGICGTFQESPLGPIQEL